MPKGDATYPAMTLDECLAFADEWSRGVALYPGAQGWRVVCMLLAEEVRRLQERVADFDDDPGATYLTPEERAKFQSELNAASRRALDSVEAKTPKGAQ